MVWRALFELAVSAAAEPVSCCLAAGGWEWCDAGEPGEACFRVDAAVVRPGDDQLGGDDRADAGLVEQLGGDGSDVAEDLALERLGFAGRGLDPLGERAQDEDQFGARWADPVGGSGGSGCSD